MEPIADARGATRRFLTEVQAVHGIAVSERAMGTVQLVVVCGDHGDSGGACRVCACGPELPVRADPSVRQG
ncbi:hypothetical protein S1361_01300 [Streptomyces cyanogenus]|uniref:Uncharacterized protein n=1 Tax=Streptomyces cyanogenus TaxID=80860 RepID=A0ABX7THL8_STRCY|nr:hypothetical protein S1361_01300 [Streptomyces cyanogenus]